MARARLSEMDDLARRLADGMHPTDWADRFDAILFEGHTQAWVLGRQRAGDLALRDVLDEIMGLEAKDRQADFLQGFLDDVLRGRYLTEDNEYSVPAIRARSRMYVRRMRGTANEAFVEAGDGAELYEWRLGPTEHCGDCVQLAALGPYQKDTMISFPGDGQTDCLINCACRLVRASDGISGFDRV